MQLSSAEKLEERRDNYQAGGTVYKKADLADNETLKEILRQNTMESWVVLSTEHEPSYFDSTCIFGETETILAFQENKPDSVVGMCSSTSMSVHINGRPVTAGYLGELRVTPNYRNKPGIIRNGFESVRKLNISHDGLSYWFTSIAKENSVARRLLEAGLKGMPIYKHQGDMLTLALSTKHLPNNDLLEAAQVEDIPALVEFYNKQASDYQYSPVLTEKWLKSLHGENGLHLNDFWLLKQDGTIRACFAIWDQRVFKQSVVRGYRFPLNILRRPYNIFASLTNRVSLPAVNEMIDYVFIAFLAIDEIILGKTDKIIQTALSLAGQRQAKVAMLGMSPLNPVYDRLKRYPTEDYYTCIENVTWPDRERLSLDARPVQPEVAIL